MPFIPQVKVGNTIYNIKDKRLDTLIQPLYQNLTKYDIPANYNDTVFPIDFSHYFEAGDYYFIRVQSGNVESAERLRFIIQSNTTPVTTIYGQKDDLKEGVIAEKITIPTSGYWRAGVRINNNSDAFSFDSFMITKNYYINTVDDLKHQINAMTTEICWYGETNIPQIDYDTENSKYVIVLPDSNNIRVNMRVDDNITIKTIAGSQAGASFDLPHDSYLLFDFNTNLFSVVSNPRINIFTNDFALCLYNSSGTLIGPWNKYFTSAKISEDISVYFYGYYAKPVFSLDANKTITVTVPKNPRLNRNRLNRTPTLSTNGDSHFVITEPEVFVVPHDHCLVYDYDANHITVEEANYSYSPRKALLFYNSNGSVNGPWRIYWLQGLVENSASANGSNIPDYYVSHVFEKAKAIASHMTQNADNTGFVFITDIHYPSNQMNSSHLVQDICRKTGITTVHLNGDYINRENTKNEALVQIPRVIGQYQFPSINTYAAVGNHEWNNPGASSEPAYLENQLNETELRWCCYSTFRNNAVFSDDSLAYYYDDEACKTRYFVGSVGRGTNPEIPSILWIANQLQSVPAGWNAVIFFHTMIHWRNGESYIVGNGTIMENVLNAVHDKTTYTYNGTTYNYTNVNYDLVGLFCGDYHLDFDYVTSSGVNIVSVTTDSLQQEGDLDRSSRTINEQAFDVVVIDRTLRKFYMHRIGAGIDREYDY